MIQCSKEKYDYLPVKCGEATNSLIYENQTFTHITLLGLTIYEIKDINCLMRNVYGWLLHNGYFIVHLVEKDKYNPLVPICNPLTDENFQKYTTKRITRGKIDFGDFIYNQNVDFEVREMCWSFNMRMLCQLLRPRATQCRQFKAMALSANSMGKSLLFASF